jgi:hypothetical protein
MTIPFEPDRGSRQNVLVWQSEVDSVVYNGQVSEWFSDRSWTKMSVGAHAGVMAPARERTVRFGWGYRELRGWLSSFGGK